MKLVREYINEKFTEDSDPINDLNIGKKSNAIDLINNDITKLFNNNGFKTSILFPNRFHFYKSFKSGYLDITIDLVNEEGLRFKKNVVDNRFFLDMRFIPYKKFLRVFKNLDYENEKHIFSKHIIFYNQQGTRITDKKILQEIESIIKKVENDISK